MPANKLKSMKTLYRTDWAEIYAALDFKLGHSPAVVDDQKWKDHLAMIMRKLGPDGQHAYSSGVAPAIKDDWWTVLLLWPDTATDNFGQDTYLGFVRASRPEFAVYAAKKAAKASMDPPDPEFNTDDLFVISVFKGRNRDYVRKWNEFQQVLEAEKQGSQLKASQTLQPKQNEE